MELNSLVNYKQTTDSLTKNNLINVWNGFKLMNILSGWCLCKIICCAEHNMKL